MTDLDDDTVNALNAEVVRQRERGDLDIHGETLDGYLGSSEYHLRQAAQHMRLFEKKRARGQ